MADKAYTKRDSAKMVRTHVRARRVVRVGCPLGDQNHKQRERIYGWEALHG